MHNNNGKGMSPFYGGRQDEFKRNGECIMQFRTDLALERQEALSEPCNGVRSDRIDVGPASITRIEVVDEEGAKALDRPVGHYVTVEMPAFSDDTNMDDDCRTAISVELGRLLPKEGLILVVGLGNDDITPDALGPQAIERILATRHISGELARSVGLGDLRPVAAVAPGVLGKTGIEVAEILEGMVRQIRPAAVVVIDALASRQLSRLGCTVQLSDTGIRPGSGVGNTRKEISQSTIGVPVIAMGVPTVVDAVTLASDLLGGDGADAMRKADQNGRQMMVTPREIDLVIERAAALIALAINCTLHPHLSPKDLLEIMA